MKNFLLFIFFTFLPLQIQAGIAIQTDYLLVDTDVSFANVKKSSLFKTYKEGVNLGFQRGKSIWIRLQINNTANTDIIKIIEIENPLLEGVFLYDNKQLLQQKGLLYSSNLETMIDPSFTLNIEKNSKQIYYIKISNHTTSLRFNISLKDDKQYLYDEHQQFGIIMLMLGIIFSLFLYTFFLYFYSKEKAYQFYGIYLFFLIWQQLTYLGITPLYFPQWFVELDNLSVVLKVNAMYISAALFAKKFLNTYKFRAINKVYNTIMVVALIEIPLFGTPWFYYPEVGIITGLVFVIFNLWAAIYIYKQGYKQARLFIAAWSVLFVGFIMMILDGLGVISIMLKFPNVILFATATEAILLSLAFTDRYILLKEEKERSDHLLLTSLEERQKIIENEIKNRTIELSQALTNQEMLLQELHHRTKNNLQLILSIIRMQSKQLKTPLQDYFLDLENRINAIATTHSLLYFQKNLQQIDINEYIHELCEQIEQSFSAQSILFIIDVQKISLPLKKASYVGLLLNEIIVNAIKHAKQKKLELNISFTKEESVYVLTIADNGEKKVILDNADSLGMELIKTLIEEQLEGEYTMNGEKGLSYLIRFK